MQKIVAVQDYSNEGRTELQGLQEQLREWELDAELRETAIIPLAKNPSEKETFEHMRELQQQEVRQVAVLGVKVRDKVRDYLYDKTTGCFFSLTRHTGSRDLLSWLVVSLSCEA
jgi:hypothetical protein